MDPMLAANKCFDYLEVIFIAVIAKNQLMMVLISELKN